MFQKIANILSIASFVLVTSVIGGSWFGYKYVTSEQFKTKMLNQVMGQVQGLLPDMLGNSIPKMTAPATPLPFKLTEPKL